MSYIGETRKQEAHMMLNLELQRVPIYCIIHFITQYTKNLAASIQSGKGIKSGHLQRHYHPQSFP